MKKRLFEIIEVANESDTLSNVYDVVMMLAIICSLVPMCFKTTNSIFAIIETVTVVLFVIDYLLRFITADLKLNKGIKSYVYYPFTFMAIIDLLSILPSLTTLNTGFKALKVLRLGRTLKVFRALKAFKAFKAFRYSSNLIIIVEVLKKQKEALTAVCMLAASYIFVTALIIFNVEPDTFENFFDAIYWATVSLTTVGYGDIFATTTLGRVITMLSAIFGIAIVALPAGIITAGYMDEINKNNK